MLKRVEGFDEADLIARDLQHIWHPCSQMKDYETLRPLVVKRAHGSYLELANGKKILDANSSWWCKLLGHTHPRLKQAVLRQMDCFEHVLLGNTTNTTIVELSEKLTHLLPTLKKVFYAGDGSSAVEIALKMSLHARQISGEKKRTRFLALRNGYHGETIGALSVTDANIYRRAYKPMLFNVNFLSDIPYVSGSKDPGWLSCEYNWSAIEKYLEPFAETTTALILEPIVQTNNMSVYSQDFLKKLREWTRQHHIHLIADEIMTGLGRTGKMLACEYAGIEPDFLCLGKNLTAGWMAFSAVLTRNDIYQLFYGDYALGNSFLHSHTYCGNALAASVACEVLNIITEENLCQRATYLEKVMLTSMQEIANNTGKLTNIRSIGTIVAADLICPDPARRLGFEIYQKAISLGALLRPLGNTIYWLLP